jgi:hypothetical protein
MGAMAAGAAIVGGMAISSMGAKKSAKSAGKQQKRMMGQMKLESELYRGKYKQVTRTYVDPVTGKKKKYKSYENVTGDEGYAGQNRDFYKGLATESRDTYRNLATGIQGNYNALSDDIAGRYDTLIGRTKADYTQAGTDAYNRYYDAAAQNLRSTGAQGMMGILSSPEGVRNDAAYKFLTGEASRETARQAGARGYGISGNVLTALQERRMNVADTYLNSIMERYGAAYGLGETARTQGLGAQDQYVSAGLGAATQLGAQSLDWQGRTRAAGVNALSQFQAMGEESYLNNMQMSQQAYQQMLDNASNLRAGQGAIAVNDAYAQSKGAAAGALMMGIGQGLTTAGSFGMMSGGFGSTTTAPTYTQGAMGANSGQIGANSGIYDFGGRP